MLKVAADYDRMALEAAEIEAPQGAIIVVLTHAGPGLGPSIQRETGGAAMTGRPAFMSGFVQRTYFASDTLTDITDSGTAPGVGG